jgi:hypothetical protein
MTRWTGIAVVVLRSGPSSLPNFFREAPSPSEIEVDFPWGRHFFFDSENGVEKTFSVCYIPIVLDRPPRRHNALSAGSPLVDLLTKVSSRRSAGGMERPKSRMSRFWSSSAAGSCLIGSSYLQ